eukprot:12893-Heterococcus_DN1.PRE.1
MKLKSWSASPILEINIAGVRAPYTIDLASVRTYRRYKTCSHEIDTGCIVLEVSSDSGIAKALGTKCLQPHMADTAIATVAKPTAIVPGASLKAVRALEAPAPPEIGRRYIVLYLRASDMTEYINGTSDAAAVNIDDDGSGSAAAAAAAASSSASQDASNDSSSQEEQRSMEITLQSALQIAAKDKLSVNHMTDSSSIDQQFCSALIRQRDEKAKAVPTRTSKRLKALSSGSTTDSKAVATNETQDRIQLVYPTEKGAQDVITLTLTDYARLDDGEFLNDNIVDFFLKISYSLRPKCVDNSSNEETLQLHIQHASYAHLRNTLNNLTGVYHALSIIQALYIDPEQIIRMRHSNLRPQQIQKELAVQEDRKAQSHFFSSHFFTKLREVPVSNFDEAYAGVQRWSRNVDLFSSKFVFVPIAEHLHWSLAILCNLHALGETVTAARQKKIQQQQHKQQQKQQQQQQKQEQQQQQQPYDITNSQTDKQTQECKVSNDDQKAVEAVSDVRQLHCGDELTNGDDVGKDSTDVSAKTTADTVIEHKASPPPPLAAAAASPAAAAAAAAAADNVNDAAAGIDADMIDGSDSDSQHQQQQQQTEQLDSVTSDIPCIIFLDSLSMHQPNRISKYLRLYVEKEWAKTYPNRKSLKLARDELPLVQPSAPMQSNGCDCGNDAKAALSTEFTHKMFTDKVIVRKRKEIRQLLDRYKDVYQSRIKEDKAAKA